MKIVKNTSYTINGASMVETIEWRQVDVDHPHGVTLSGEDGKWEFVGGTNLAHDTASALIPREPIDILVTGPNGQLTTTQIPSGFDQAPEYWDYYNLPLKAGVVLT